MVVAESKRMTTRVMMAHQFRAEVCATFSAQHLGGFNDEKRWRLIREFFLPRSWSFLASFNSA
jgi:hypothetical protein